MQESSESDRDSSDANEHLLRRNVHCRVVWCRRDLGASQHQRSGTGVASHLNMGTQFRIQLECAERRRGSFKVDA